MHRYTIRAMLLAIVLAASSPAVTYASPLDIENVNTMIEQIPEREDLESQEKNDETVALIRDAMKIYNSLTDSEKLQVVNYERLETAYEWGVRNNLIEEKDGQDTGTEEEKRIAAEQTRLEESGDVETSATEYVFSVTENMNSASVVIRYTTDLDGDGNGDAPERLVITSPEGKIYAVTNSSPGLKEEGLNIIFTWESKFMQIDMAEGPAGKWKIVSSDPAAFSLMPYAGPRMEIMPENEETEEPAETEVGTPQEEPEEEEKDTASIAQLVLIGVAAVAFIILGKKYGMFGADKVEDEDGIDDDYSEDDSERKKGGKKKKKGFEEPKPVSDEEYMEEMRREYKQRREKETEEEKQDRGDSTHDDVTEDDNGEGYKEYVETGKTGLLNIKDRPTDNGGGLKEDEDEDENENDDENNDEDNMFDFDT